MQGAPDEDKLSPKLGVVWTPRTGTTVRAAAFHIFRRTLINDQTLEPTQVAGFSQFFDDPGAATAWRYGVGVDQKLPYGLFVGAEGSRRDLTSPVFNATTNAFENATSKQWDARAYAFWIPLRFLAMRSEYSFARLLGENLGGAHDATTHRVPLGLGLFLPFGLAATGTGTFFHQEGSFQVPSASPDPAFQQGTSEFWLLDAALTWRLPRRRGLVSLVGTNLLDKKFQLFEQGFSNTNPTVQPGRAVFARLTLAGP